jgi:hypothetical protein
MTNQVLTLIEPFVQRGLFESPEKAIIEMARGYILHQIEQNQAVIEKLQAKYGMTYDQFQAYLKARSSTLVMAPSAELNQAIMAEEEDALDWKVAHDMLVSWLGLRAEVGV